MHLVKLCVGVGSLEELEGYRAERAHWWGADYGEDVHVHRTRMMPVQAKAVEAGGSLYWVIAGLVRCRQRVLRLAASTDDAGRPCCDIVMAPDLVPVLPQPRRPFQGWRYLKPTDAPPDISGAGGEGSMVLLQELARLGLA